MRGAKVRFLSLPIVFLHWRHAPRPFFASSALFMPFALRNVGDCARHCFPFFTLHLANLLFLLLFPQVFRASARSPAEQALRWQKLITEHQPSPYSHPSERVPLSTSALSSLEQRSPREASRSEAPSCESRASSSR